MDYEEYLRPNRRMFHDAPFEYGNAAYAKWLLVQAKYGGKFDLGSTPNNLALKDPFLWLNQARALLYAAKTVVLDDKVDFGLPDFPEVQSICDSQYCAAGLMLLGYSLEVMLKGMTLLECGIEEYRATEKNYLHHRLDKLGKIMPSLSARDIAMLRTLSYFTSWAGRYPDPGENQAAQHESIYDESEEHKVTFHDLVLLAEQVMSHARTYANKARDLYR